MQWLLRYEAKSASKLGIIYRVVHGVDAPLPGYISRATVFSIPTQNGPVAAFRYFTDPQVFGEKGFCEMRAAMKDAVVALKREEGATCPRFLATSRSRGSFSVTSRRARRF